MNDREREELEEVLAVLYEAEQESKELYGGFHPKIINARRRVEGLLDEERSYDPIEIDDDVTLLRGRE